MGARPGRAAVVRADPGQEPVDGEADPLEGRAEELRLLVAVTAAATVDDLVLDVRQVHAHAPAEQDVEVLEADRAQVRPVQRGQGRLVRGDRSGVADAAQVRVQIQRGR
jgi:hypothetical protein